jgi:hypothetical protein
MPEKEKNPQETNEGRRTQTQGNEKEHVKSLRKKWETKSNS